MITITTDQYVQDEGTGGKTILTFTVTATDVFWSGTAPDGSTETNGNQAMIGIRILEKGMNEADGLKLLTDGANGVKALDAYSGNIMLNAKDADKNGVITKTIKVEVDGDANIEANEMFGVALTQGWMMQDGKTVTGAYGQKGDDVGHPIGNFSVNQVALQVVRNDDGPGGKVDEDAFGALGKQVDGIMGSADTFTDAMKSFEKDVEEGRKDQPKREEDKTPAEKKAELDEKFEDLFRKLNEAEDANDKGAAEEITKEIHEVGKQINELEKQQSDEEAEKAEEERKAKEAVEDAYGPETVKTEQSGLDDTMIEFLLNSGDAPASPYAAGNEVYYDGSSADAGVFSYFDYDAIA